MLNKNNKELKANFECIESQTKAPLKQYISLFNFNPKVDASTSCNDLIDISYSPLCNEKCIENIFVEPSNGLIAQENDKLKQEAQEVLGKTKGQESCPTSSR